MTLIVNSHLLAMRYPWYLTTDEIRLICDEIITFIGWENAHFRPKMVKISNLTLPFDLEMTLRANSHLLTMRYSWYLTTDEIWVKWDEIIRFNGWKNAHFRPKIAKIPKFDLDLWPWNDLEVKFSFNGNEINLIPNHRLDMTEIFWNHWGFFSKSR